MLGGVDGDVAIEMGDNELREEFASDKKGLSLTI